MYVCVALVVVVKVCARVACLQALGGLVGFRVFRV